MMWLETTEFTIRTPAQKNVLFISESKALNANIIEKIEAQRTSNPDSLG